ncbi:Mitochondrial beta-keto-acyl synthase [Chytriomyces hyalinus]|nr:Mitochondrial beta-keto-acyl synthase [Chytriomyces hyalinus]
MKRRVVVTGLGAVTPLGVGVKETWTRLVAGECGVVSVAGESGFEMMPSQVAGRVKGFDASQWVPKQDTSKTTPFMHYAYAAAQMALTDANWFPATDAQRHRSGVCVGSGIGCIDEIASTALSFHEKGLKRVSPFFVPRTLVNMAAGNLSIRHGFQGPNHSVSTACATGAHSIGDAFRFIQYGDADVMLAGGTEASITPLSFAGFCRAKSLVTKFNDRPEEACRPFDEDRDGFVMGEGAAVLLLEEFEHAKARGATMYAEVRGYGLTGDANHITSPPEDGNGAARAMKRALETAGMRPEDVDYVNAHATGTMLGDLAETRAIQSVFGPDSKVAVSSTKGAVGHLLGAAGAVEALFTLLAVHHDIIPPTLNLNKLGPEFTLNYVRGKESLRGNPVRAAVSNSFGFGGTNASLVFSKVN